MKRIIGRLLLVIVLLCTGAVLYVFQQNSFDMREQSIEIDSPQGKLTGTLVLPKNASGKLGLVLFIHGDGPINASHGDGYKPLWERLAAQGYASLSLNKRGIDGSAGNWLDQSIDDRVEEARQALAWARTQPMIDPSRIGVWGASQAGWVIPKLAGKEPLAFSILVSPAINWLTQGEYNTRMQMAKDGYSGDEISAQIAYEQQIKELLAKNATYEEYVKAANQEDVMSRDRWTFVGKNFRADATDDLQHFNSPVLLLLGEEDVNVDWRETEEVYRREVSPSLLTVKVFPGAEHSMLTTRTADSRLRAVMISLFAPRQITVKGYMEQIADFLQKLP
ncbi:alpha/beta hydrolase [Paenibacillus sp. P3E]|uniref:alpha/beta hydrolase family protein n=1 Tax=unclassified Paenibacillus TaxID=185978 RepID=UPI00093B983D|nr:MULTISPECIES: alpha/beta hydrolase [unclassified Paenibacillus]OKP79532.1 alpha/beta hydrolase [Paenibacillus sp. P3E]OKP86299.1 alpha/beta hydrolase [Paenibacillus sp. P32E]